jgi:lysylphosphatidylglycerol synthetase-like protein (DUF2156 family)
MDTTSMQVQALIALAMPLAIQLAKRSKTPLLAWIDQAKPRVCIVTNAIASLATAGGIEFARNAHSLTISWPDGATMLRGVLTFLVSAILQFATQHALYEGLWRHVVASPSNPPMARTTQIYGVAGQGHGQ